MVVENFAVCSKHAQEMWENDASIQTRARLFPRTCRGVRLDLTPFLLPERDISPHN